LPATRAFGEQEHAAGRDAPESVRLEDHADRHGECRDWALAIAVRGEAGGNGGTGLADDAGHGGQLVELAKQAGDCLRGVALTVGRR